MGSTVTIDQNGQATSPTVSRGRRLRDPLLVAGAVGIGALALHLRDPHVSGSWGFCPWALLTGMDCPGCGSLRAVNDLTNGDLAGAASSNLLLVAAVPVVAALWLAWAQRSWVARPRRVPGRAARKVLWVAAITGIVVFTVLRNTPAGAWLHS